jgi:hypothetical protein
MFSPWHCEMVPWESTRRGLLEAVTGHEWILDLDIRIDETSAHEGILDGQMSRGNLQLDREQQIVTNHQRSVAIKTTSRTGGSLKSRGETLLAQRQDRVVPPTPHVEQVEGHEEIIGISTRQLLDSLGDSPVVFNVAITENSYQL